VIPACRKAKSTADINAAVMVVMMMVVMVRPRNNADVNSRHHVVMMVMVMVMMSYPNRDLRHFGTRR
jgi:hypothetical protein